MVRLFCYSGHSQWELQAFRLDACPPFNALSYTWGPNRYECEILVNSKILSVSRNLLGFLKTRYAQVGWWWVDQISIDQDCLEERNLQVSIMKDIYRTASQVFVWLDSVADRICRVLSVELAHNNLSYQTVKRFDIEITKLLDHRYWSRVWVIQELLFAKKVEVVYSSSSMSMERLQQIVRHHRSVSARPWHRASRLIQLATSLAQNPADGLISLPVVLNFIASKGCTDMRDTIFGIQGILKLKYRQEIDYNKDTWAVFLETVHILVENWPKNQPVNNLLSMCLRLGEMMLPDFLRLHRLVDRDRSDILQKIIEVQKMPQNEAEKAKEHIVTIFTDISASGGPPPPVDQATASTLA